MGSMKEESIRHYVSSIDFNRDDWRLPQIKEDVILFLHD